MHCREITIAYGQTESSPVITQTSVDDSIERRVATVGRALPHTEVDCRSGQRTDCAPRTTGRTVRAVI
jgi:fatty-acyl-CoA synthase